MNASEREKFNLSAWALANQQLVAFFMLVLTIAGVMSYYNLPRNEDPAFTIKTAVVSASWPGALCGGYRQFRDRSVGEETSGSSLS